MKRCLETEITLGSIGDLFDELEQIFPIDKHKPKIINKAKTRKQIFNYILPELVKYYNKLPYLIEKIDNDNIIKQLNIEKWQKALELISSILRPILSNTFVLKTLKKVDTSSGNYIMNVITYKDEKTDYSEKKITFEELEEYQKSISELLMTYQNTQISINLSPFLMIENDKLHFYKRTRAAGYEYYSILDNSVSIIETKKKFNHAVYKTGRKGDLQTLFWTEVLPSVNELNGIRANIPTEDLDHFVGRKKQIKKIKEEIIEIPNQNGFVYGVGGVGKTALMLQVSRELYEEKNKDNVYFDNIIWVSAKTNYYNYMLNITEPRERGFESLDHIFSVILRFFEYEDAEEYSFEEKQDLVLELFEENKTFLILDNFETIAATISKNEAKKIIQFFEIDVKRRLRTKPDYFKVIVTSRSLIPTGFHQIELEGLDLRESKQLMKNIYKRYKSLKPELTEEQKEEINKVTHGVPIIIKHCIAQIFEFNRPFNDVISKLSNAINLIEFSFAEIFNLLNKDECQLRIIILLEIINYPLIIRQIADILEIDEYRIENKIPDLINYQCIERINHRLEEKFMINEKVSLFTKNLVQKNSELEKSIRDKITSNYTLEKRMDYTTDELFILNVFTNYLSEKKFLDAEIFIKEQLGKKPNSILLKYHYAKYLKDQKREIETAIQILKDVSRTECNNPNMLKLLLSCYMTLDIPTYDEASIYVNELKDCVESNDIDTKLEMAEFYVKWSTFIKLKRDADPIREIVRQQQYKELANKAISILNSIKNKTHKFYYLFAHSYFNLWDYENSLKMIENAIELIEENPAYYSTYTYLRKLILSKKSQYSKKSRF